MKIKFIFYTDPHVTCVNPRHRTDDYSKMVMEKLREIYQVAEEESAEFLVMGGDLFNAHRLFSYEVINDLMDIMCTTKLNTYAVVGQHDIHAYNPHTYKTSTLAFIAHHCARFKILWEPLEVVPNVRLYPSHVWEDIQDSLKPKILFPGDYNILVAHHLIHNQKKMFETVPTTMFAHGPYDLVLSGDWHGGFEPEMVGGGVWCCNPGSLVRRSIDEIDRPPRYAVIEIEKGQFPIIEQRRLKCAKPGKDVFSEDYIEILKKDTTVFDPSAFIDNVQDFEAQSVDVHELIQKAGIAKNIRREVLDYLASKKTA